MANQSLEQFVKSLVNFDSVENVLNTFADASIKGFIFERLWDLVIKFGCCSKFPSNEYDHMDGNFQLGLLNPIKNLLHYLRKNKLLSGNAGGCVDIVLKDKKKNHYICISCKFYCNKTNINKAGISDILAAVNANRHIYESFQIYTAIKDKNTLKRGNHSSNHISKYVNEEHILDTADLNVCFQLLKVNLMNIAFESINDVFSIGKPHLNLYFHQRLIIDKTLALCSKGERNFLWACKCRSGKTYMVGGLIAEKQKNVYSFNTLIITPVIATVAQFTHDLLHKYREFNHMNIVHVTSGTELKNITFSSKKNVIIISKQLLDDYVNDNCIDALKKLMFDLIIFDENHYGGTTEYSRSIITTYSTSQTIKIYLTATFMKALLTWNIHQECQLFWDIEDEKWCKEGNLDKLADKHGEIFVYKVMETMTDDGYDIAKEFQNYNRYPDLHILTNMFDEKRYLDIMQDIQSTKYGFSMEALLSLNDTQCEFKFRNEVQTFLGYISGSNKYRDFPNGDISVFARIKKISHAHKNRTTLDNKCFSTQLWFLPFGKGMLIDKVSKCLQECILIDSILKDFDTLILNSKGEHNVKDIKATISNAEALALNNGKKGLILLVGEQCSLGISLHQCDIVMLFNSIMSADVIWQMMYRSMTDAPMKTCGFVVDMNPSRVLNTLLEYNISCKDMSIQDKVQYVVHSNLIHIDDDMFVNKEIQSETVGNKLMAVWSNDPYNKLKTLLQRLENQVIELNETDQKILNNMFIKGHDSDKVNIQVKLDDENEQTMPKGHECLREEVREEDNEKVLIEDEKVIPISLAKDLLPFIIPLVCLLTIKDNNRDFVDMLSSIANNEELIDVFNGQTFIWWSQNNIMNLVLDIATRYIKKNSDTYNIAIQFKMSLKSLIDQPELLLEFINSCLKPKREEKRKFGEVFTPIDFIKNSMLADLHTYIMKNHNDDIFKNSTLKWFDPAAGMGNYHIVIYDKLMEGLSEEFPNPEERKRHILENMLYFAELNKKNCFMIKQIFNIDDKYRLNLHEGDSLTLNTLEVFGVAKFDIVIGNPPYNQELTKVGALPLYNKFIEKYIDNCNFLSFIVPSRWFAGGKGLDKFRKSMLERKDIPYIKHYRNASDIFGNTVDIKGGVNFFLKDAVHNGVCSFNGSSMNLNAMDVIVDSAFIPIINKLARFDRLNALYISQDHYKIQTNDSRLTDDSTLMKCYVSKQKGFTKYISKTHITKPTNMCKIITARASYKASSAFGNTFVGYENEVHSKSYISFNVQSPEQAQSLLSYLQCKLPNLLLSLRKSSQDISENTCKWIPLPPLDKQWTNNEVYNYFNLTEEEVLLVKDTKIVGYKETSNECL